MRLLFTLYLVVLSLSSFAQQRYAVMSGNWTDAIWATTANGIAGTAATPTATDDVYTNGFSVIVNGNVTCQNLFVEFNIANSITFSNALRTLTITGTLLAWDSGNGFEEFPTDDVISDVGKISFTGANIGIYAPYVIYGWDPTVSDFGLLTFSLGAGNTFNLFSPISINGTAANKTVTISSGTLQTDPGAYIEAKNGASTGVTLTINSGATLSTADYIAGTTNITGFNTISVNGTLSTSSYVNANSFSVGSAGVLNTSFTGADQTEGWWYQSARPTGGTLNATSTVSFKAAADQNVYARSYGNLFLDGSGTKTLTGAGTLNIAGSLTINSSSITFSTTGAINIGGDLINNGTFAPNSLVTFNGSAAQQIGGTTQTSFAGGLTVNNSAGTVTLARNTSVSGGLTLSAGTLDLAAYDFTINSGDIINSGTLTPSNSTVIISGTTSVLGTSTTSFHNLTINGTLTAPSTLNISGNLTNNGTFNANSGTLVFNGTTDQSISGTLTANNIDITNDASTNGIAINGTVNLNGTLTLVNSGSKLDADGSGSGSLVINSTSVNSGGRIAALPATSNFIGSVTVQRFINGPDTWRYLSMPVTNGTVSMWKDDFPVTGNFSDPSPVGTDGVVSSSAPSIYRFSPATNQYVAIGSGGSTASTALSNAIGYSAYSYKSGDFTISVSGTIGKGDVPVTVSTANGGYNLVPNPYPSAIDWDAVTKTGLNNAMWVRVASNEYASYVDGVAVDAPFVGWTGEVATGQSFWVQSTSAATLTFQEDDKTSGQYEFMREAEPRNYIRVTLSSSQQRDEAVIRFANDASESLDGFYDAQKRKNGDYSASLKRYSHMNISSYTTSPSDDYSINGIPLVQCAKNVKLKVEDVAEGNYKLKFTDLDKMDLGYEIKLVDNFLHEETPVQDGMEYNFSVTSDTASSGTSRFELTFNSPTVDVQRSLPLASVQSCNDPLIKLSISNSQPGIQYLFKHNDIGLHEAVTGDGEDISVMINKSNLPFGLNKLSLVASSLDGCHTHVFDDVLAVRSDEIREVESVTSASSCGNGSVVLSASGAPPEGSYLWYDSIDAIDPVAGANKAVFNTPVLTESKTYFVTAVNESGCESSIRVPVEAKIINNPVPEINVNGYVLAVINAKSGIQWYKDDVPVEGATEVEFEVKESGSYKVSVEKDGCTAESEAREFIINGIEERSSGFKIYPNPVDRELLITGHLQNVEISLYDGKGKLIAGNRDSNSIAYGDGQQVVIDMSYLKKGLYLVNLQKGNHIFQFKVIKK